MPYATAADGAQLYYEVRGTQGPFLFLGPAIGESASQPRWLRLNRGYAADLSRDYRVILLDQMRGSGRSEARHPPLYTPTVCASDLLAVADAAGARRFAWCGFSWGAVIGLQLALRSDRVTALLCGGWPVLDGHYDWCLGAARAMATRAPMRWIRPLRESGERLAQYYGVLAQWSAEDQRRQVAALECPRLLFIGEQDRAGHGLADTVRKTQPELEALGWRVTWLPGAGHTVSRHAQRILPVIRGLLDPLREAGRLD